MEFKNALENMCQRCSIHEQCTGTGCNPKFMLESLIKEHEIVLAMYEGIYQKYIALLEKNEK